MSQRRTKRARAAGGGRAAGWVCLLVALPVAACSAVLDFDVEGYPVEAGANGSGGRNGTGGGGPGGGGAGVASGGLTGSGGASTGGVGPGSGGADGGFVEPDGGDAGGSSGGSTGSGGTDGGGGESSGGAPGDGGPGAGGASSGGAGNAGGASSGGASSGGTPGAGGACPSPTRWYADGDNDTYGNDDSFQDACEKPAGQWVDRAGDCHDGNPAVNPGHGAFEEASYAKIGGGISYDWDCSDAETGDPAQTVFNGCPALLAQCNGNPRYVTTGRSGAGVNAFCGSTTTTSCSVVALVCVRAANVPADPYRCK